MLEKMKMTGDVSTPKRQYYLLTSKLLINGDDDGRWASVVRQVRLKYYKVPVLMTLSCARHVLRHMESTRARDKEGGEAR